MSVHFAHYLELSLPISLLMAPVRDQVWNSLFQPPGLPGDSYEWHVHNIDKATSLIADLHNGTQPLEKNQKFKIHRFYSIKKRLALRKYI